MKEIKNKFVGRFVKLLIEAGKTADAIFEHRFLFPNMPRPQGLYTMWSYKGVRNLEHRNVLKKVNGGYCFTRDGKKWFRQHRNNYFFQKNIKWDHQWRIVIFDIPQEMHRQRNNFRNKLKSLGFYMLQKSVFVFPYPCEEELGDICDDLGITECVDIITAHKIGFKESEIINYFNLAKK